MLPLPLDNTTFCVVSFMATKDALSAFVPPTCKVTVWVAPNVPENIITDDLPAASVAVSEAVEPSPMFRVLVVPVRATVETPLMLCSRDWRLLLVTSPQEPALSPVPMSSMPSPSV